MCPLELSFFRLNDDVCGTLRKTLHSFRTVFQLCTLYIEGRKFVINLFIGFFFSFFFLSERTNIRATSDSLISGKISLTPTKMSGVYS